MMDIEAEARRLMVSVVHFANGHGGDPEQEILSSLRRVQEAQEAHVSHWCPVCEDHAIQRGKELHEAEAVLEKLPGMLPHGPSFKEGHIAGLEEAVTIMQNYTGPVERWADPVRQRIEDLRREK
jgi:hypothetical protein